MLIVSSEMEVKHCRRMLRFNTEQLWRNLIRQGWKRVPQQWCGAPTELYRYDQLPDSDSEKRGAWIPFGLRPCFCTDNVAEMQQLLARKSCARYADPPSCCGGWGEAVPLLPIGRSVSA